jgi:PPIC-type PPIASE domain
LTRLLKEPLLHFLVLGAALFGLFSFVGDEGEAAKPAKIVVSAARINNLASGFARTWQRSPTQEEMQGLVEDHIREEIFYREGKALGLDRDDVIVRRRIRQKMEFMLEGMNLAEPDDDQLGAYLAAHAERFRSADLLSFRHVFLSASRRTALEDDAKETAAKLASAKSVGDTAALGDPFLLGEEFSSTSAGDIARTFGERFAERISALEPGGWQGPIPSGYGLHFVLVSERRAGSLLPLDAVRPAVRREWLSERRMEAEQTFYRTLRQRYEIMVEGPANEGTNLQERVGASR